MERDYWDAENQRRFLDLDKAIKAENQRHEDRIGPYRDKFLEVLRNSSKQMDTALSPFIRAYEEWQGQIPPDMTYDIPPGTSDVQVTYGQEEIP